jgi:hypothetical protein
MHENLYEEKKTIFSEEEHDEHVHKINDKKIHSDDIRSYMNRCILMYIIIAGLSYIPGLLVIFFRDEEVQTKLFFQIGWLAIVALVVHYLIAITAYLKPQIFFDRWPMTFLCFALWCLTLFTINSIISLYSPELMLTYSGIIVFAMMTLFILNYSNQLNDKGWIKCAILYSILFIYVILYMILIKKRFVEFFILCIVMISFFSYTVLQMKHLLFGYVKEGRFFTPTCHSNLYMWSIMVVSVDVLTCAFH